MIFLILGFSLALLLMAGIAVKNVFDMIELQKNTDEQIKKLNKDRILEILEYKTQVRELSSDNLSLHTEIEKQTIELNKKNKKIKKLKLKLKKARN